MKVLMCTEASFLPTGYGVYSKELLSRLNQYPDIEVAELSCYTDVNSNEFQQIPWKAYANKPTGAKELQEYLSHKPNEYGEFSFNTACLDFRPDVVIDIRDVWMWEYQARSPFRKFFNHVVMPTVDATPQYPEWIDMFVDADGVLTYTEFGRDTILQQSDQVNFLGIAPPCASHDFKPIPKGELRNELGLSTDIKIIGTVMRNQRRKLYPDLFYTFARISKNKPNVFLHCHTNYPDVGWDIPELLIEYELAHKVLFTYHCTNCNELSINFFQDNKTFCNKCHSFNNSLCGVRNGINNEQLNKIYNNMDIYVQYADSEGFGMPQLEAAYAGLPIITVDYSAMESVANNLGLYKIPTMLKKEVETGCYRAFPYKQKFIDMFEYLLNKPEEELYNIGREIRNKALKQYNWDITAKIWYDAILTMKPVNNWLSQIDIKNPASFNNNLQTPLEQTNFLINQVLCKPELQYSTLWRRLLRDLTYQTRLEYVGDFYFTEHHYKNRETEVRFNYQDAYKEMLNLRDYYNKWELNRKQFYGL